MVVSSCWKQPVVQNMNSISLLWPSWLKECGLECGDALKQRLEEEIWESYLCEEKCMLGHEVSMASWLCWFYQVWYCTVQSTWYSDCDYANIEDISFHEGAVQVQNGVIFYSYAAFNNTEDWREDYSFMGPLCCITGQPYRRKCSESLPVWVEMENMIQQATISKKVWMAQNMEFWYSCKGPKHNAMGSSTVKCWGRWTYKNWGRWGQPHFSSSLPSFVKDNNLLWSLSPLALGD